MPILVKVARLGNETKEIALEEGAKVRDALVAAGEEVYEGEELRIDGRVASEDDTVYDGDVIVIAPKSKQGV